jgi:beta-glucanase (GH16 family)
MINKRRFSVSVALIALGGLIGACGDTQTSAVRAGPQDESAPDEADFNEGTGEGQRDPGGSGAGGSGTGGSGAGGDPGDPYRGYEEPLESYVKTPFFDDFNGTQVDSSAERSYVEDGNLKMIFINDSTQGYLSSAIQTREEFYYGRWEARLKPSNVPGVLNSMYTLDWDNTVDGSSSRDGTKQEIDIEFLTFAFTGDDGRVHFAVHAEGLSSFDTNPDVLLGFDPSADFHVWGFDITPEKIEWFVDDQVLWTYDYAENPIIIDAPYVLKFNFWSSTDWINGPPVADTEIVYLIDWVRFTPYGT